MTTSSQALQSWLALEHEAVWLYPVLGARFGDLADRAADSYAAHRAARDRLLAQLRAREVTAPSTLLSYDVGPLRTDDHARRAARRVERSIAAACLALVDTTTGDARATAIGALTAAARAELAWGARPSAFPGLP
ncbi:MAG: hypothetical protein JWP31_1856 [Aeromicrobium sp.]|nr:hypothetical protein [Aeromicrobium sp.]